ncbi:MAG: S-adenosyl-l-methionine hydroxide adenosyltransferase family protein [Dehalococcoidia bacterium]
MAKLTRPIVLLSDFGTRDAFVGQMKAVISGIAPAAPIIDLTHAVEPFAVDEGAWTLECAMAVLPDGAVILAVVDPGVGTERRGVAIRAEGRVFIGPDNGLLSAAFPAPLRGRAGDVPASHALGSAAVEVRELVNPQFQRPHVSPTFHGRDIFAPAAAHIAAGLDFRHLGPPRHDAHILGPFTGRPGPQGELRGRVIHVDRFGNLVTTVRAHELFPQFDLQLGAHHIDRRVWTFGAAPDARPFCYPDSSGFVAIAINQASAAATLGARRGDPVVVRAQP